MRIRSKNTGKVFDINFKFVQDHLPVDQATLGFYLNSVANVEEDLGIE